MSAFVTSNLEFDTAGLMLRKDEADRRLWLNGFNDVIELRVFNKPPDIPVRLRDAPGLRSHYEAAARTQSAEVLTLEVIDDGPLRLIRLLMRSAAKPRGFTYVGSIAVPFKRGSFVLRHQATEIMPRDDLSVDADALHPAHALTRIRASLSAVKFTPSPTLLIEPLLEAKPWYAFWQR
jgi:hypothetical protein